MKHEPRLTKHNHNQNNHYVTNSTTSQMISHYKQSELPTLPSLFYFELFLSLASTFSTPSPDFTVMQSDMCRSTWQPNPEAEVGTPKRSSWSALVFGLLLTSFSSVRLPDLTLHRNWCQNSPVGQNTDLHSLHRLNSLHLSALCSIFVKILCAGIKRYRGNFLERSVWV